MFSLCRFSMIYLRLFETEEEYSSYMESDSLILPNVSLMGGDIVKFNPLPSYIHTDYEYVDLGLPSGLKWAKCNIGAEKETDCGLYFAWGETVGYKDVSSGKSFSEEDYTWYRKNESETSITKYNNSSSYGTVDNLTTLEPSDDSATVNMSSLWRIPTKEEYEELLNNTTNTWEEIEGINGLMFTGNNGNTLFLPAAGVCELGAVQVVNSYGYYWSSSLSSDEPMNGSCLFFAPEGSGMMDCPRYYGLGIRAVCSTN